MPRWKITLRQCFILLCIAGLLAGELYITSWYAGRSRVRAQTARYSALYNPDQSPEATVLPEETPETTVLPEETPGATALQKKTPAPTSVPLPDVQDELLPEDERPILYALPTPPPVQDSFAELLQVNPETVAFLRIDDILTLPVVQRENDNEFYLTHNFEQDEAPEGTLFLDGLNRLVPEDGCLIVYGHNMHNGSMFAPLSRFADADALIDHAIVHFDTLYENRLYVPFAAFAASVNPESADYFNVRQFFPNGEDTSAFIEELKARSIVDVPLDVRSGDRLLLLVTCEYTHDDGRFILALRQLRPDETEEDILKAPRP